MAAGRCRASAVVLLLALPVTAWGRSATDATQGASWQQTLVQAGDWVRSAGPDGRYGAFDAGVLGYRLDGERTVVNLDGLVNDYDYARFLGQQPSLRARLAHQGIDVLVNRLSAAERAELDCATALAVPGARHLRRRRVVRLRARRAHLSVARPPSPRPRWRARVRRGHGLPCVGTERKAPTLPTRVVIAEDEAIIRLDLKETPKRRAGDVVGETGRGDEAVELVKQHEPDIAIPTSRCRASTACLPPGRSPASAGPRC